MAVFSSQGQAFNQTRQAYLATALAVADTHWTRLRGLLGLKSSDFRNGCGLWIVPCHGVHTLGMGFPIDVMYLDRAMTVIHIQRDLQPWRFAPVERKPHPCWNYRVELRRKREPRWGIKLKSRRNNDRRKNDRRVPIQA
jgi:uncharacterized protein